MPSSYNFNEYPVATEYPPPSLKMKTNYTKPPAVEAPYTRIFHESPSPSPFPTITRIGRPPKATSNTKMAHYARNDRAVKKEQMHHSEVQNEELLADNVGLRKHNLALQDTLKQQQKEMQSLRVVLDQNSQISSIVNRMGGGQLAGSSKDVRVCFHMVGGRVSVVLAAYKFIYNYCCTGIYIFNGNWPQFALSAYHMAMVSSLLLSNIYVSVSCTTAFLRTQKEREELRRRSPNSSFITAFAQRLGSPPNAEATETFRCRGASASSIEDLLADYEAVDAVTLI